MHLRVTHHHWIYSATGEKHPQQQQQQRRSESNNQQAKSDSNNKLATTTTVDLKGAEIAKFTIIRKVKHKYIQLYSTTGDLYKSIT